jgi:DNA-binding MarR family transcriptional regulator
MPSCSRAACSRLADIRRFGRVVSVRVHAHALGSNLATPSTRSAFSALPGHIIDKIRDGAPRGSRSEAAQSIALSLVNHGHAFADFHALMTDQGNGISDWGLYRSNGRPRTPADRQARIRRCWDSALARYQSSPPVRDAAESLAQIAELMEAARDYPWPSRTSITDRMVMDAVYQHAIATRRLNPSISYRQIREATGLGIATIHSAMKRLLRYGLLRIEVEASTQSVRHTDGGLGYITTARRYHLTTPEAHPLSGGSTTNRGVAPLTRKATVLTEPPSLVALPDPISGVVSSAHDVFSGAPRKADRAGGLGRYAAILYDATPDDPVSMAELIRRSGLGRNTVRKHLKALIGVGLVAHEEGTGYHRTGADLDEVAAEIGVAGHAGDRKAQHALERELWRQASPGIQRARRGAAPARNTPHPGTENTCRPTTSSRQEHHSATASPYASNQAGDRVEHAPDRRIHGPVGHRPHRQGVEAPDAAIRASRRPHAGVLPGTRQA